jgi:hypothetical protein
MFLGEIEAFWRQGSDRVLPLIADYPMRSEMTKALRLGELAPENRWPLFVYEARFVDDRTYFDGLVQALMLQYDDIRQGVAEEGVQLPAFTTEGVTLTGLERALVAVERAAMLLGEPFHGILVALVPEHVMNVATWRNGVARMCGLPRAASTLAEVAAALQRLLTRLGLAAQAAHVASMLAPGVRKARSRSGTPRNPPIPSGSG